jgi:hypothetical protein
VKSLRSVLGVIVGYAIFAVSAVLLFGVTGRDPHAEQDIGFIAAADAFGVVFALLGGYLAGRIAGRRPILHAGIVGILIVSGASASLLSSLGKGAVWSQVSAILLMAPAAVLGGVLRAKAQGEQSARKSRPGPVETVQRGSDAMERS